MQHFLEHVAFSKTCEIFYNMWHFSKKTVGHATFSKTWGIFQNMWRFVKQVAFSKQNVSVIFTGIYIHVYHILIKF